MTQQRYQHFISYLNLILKLANMGKLLKSFFVLVGSAVLYAFFVPVENFDPQIDVIPQFKQYQAQLYDDKFVQHLQAFRSPDLAYPEDLDVDESTGHIYTGLKNGSVVKVSSQGVEIIGQAKGFVIGSKLRGHQLYFLDNPYGVCRMDLNTKQIEYLTTEFEGKPFKCIDNFDVAKDGKVYFTEASLKYNLDDFMLDLLEGKPYGRVYVWDPETKQTSLVMDNLYFPNGLEVAHDQQSIYVSETNAARIIQIFISGSKKGTKQTVIDNLPGFPDNIKLNSQGDLWVAFPTFRDSLTENMLAAKEVRGALAHLPSSVHLFLAGLNKYAGGMKLDVVNRKIIKIFKSTDSTKIFFVTTILEKNGRLYFGSLMSDSIAVMKLPQEFGGEAVAQKVQEQVQQSDEAVGQPAAPIEQPATLAEEAVAESPAEEPAAESPAEPASAEATQTPAQQAAEPAAEQVASETAPEPVAEEPPAQSTIQQAPVPVAEETASTEEAVAQEPAETPVPVTETHTETEAAPEQPTGQSCGQPKQACGCGKAAKVTSQTPVEEVPASQAAEAVTETPAQSSAAATTQTVPAGDTPVEENPTQVTAEAPAQTVSEVPAEETTEPAAQQAAEPVAQTAAQPVEEQAAEVTQEPAAEPAAQVAPDAPAEPAEVPTSAQSAPETAAESSEPVAQQAAPVQETQPVTETPETPVQLPEPVSETAQTSSESAPEPAAEATPQPVPTLTPETQQVPDTPGEPASQSAVQTPETGSADTAQAQTTATA